MDKPIVLHLVTSLALVGGTSAKVRTLITNSKYSHLVFHPQTDLNNNYIEEWRKIKNCILIEGLTRKNYLKDAFNINKLIKEYNINIIHVYFPPDTITASIVKYLNPKIKLIRSFEGNVNQRFIKRNIVKFALRNFDKAIYISNYVKRFYETKIPKSLCFKGTIIFNAAARQSSINTPINHSSAANKIVSVSGLNTSKNLFVLVEAVHILKEKGIPVYLDILGDGPLKQNLQEKIKLYGLQENITLLGFSDKVLEYLDASSIYVHPADNEGFGISVIEAMQRYCAVIVSDRGALPEIIKDQENGLIANAYDEKEWANKILLLLNDQSLINKLGEAAFETANQKFCISNYVENHEKIYSSL